MTNPAPSERLVRVTLEYSEGTTVIKEGVALEAWESTFVQGIAALIELSLLKKQEAIRNAQQVKAETTPKDVPAPKRLGWGRRQDSAPTEDEPPMNLKQALENK